jgi:hypothetical protein
MINLTSFILGICLTSICFLIYLRYKKKTRGRKVIFHNLKIHSGDVLPSADDTIIKNLVTKSYVDSLIKKGEGGIYQ